MTMEEHMTSIIDEWRDVVAPAPPTVEAVTLSPAVCALLVLDLLTTNCTPDHRPRCVARLPRVARLLTRARDASVCVVHSITSSATADQIWPAVAPLADEPIIAASVDKFHGTELEEILTQRAIETTIIVGTSAHGAVLHTATGAALRGHRVVVPVDGLSADTPFAEQYTTWHLANAPGTRRAVTLTRTDLIAFFVDA